MMSAGSAGSAGSALFTPEITAGPEGPFALPVGNH